MRYFDAHVHLDLMTNAAEVASQAQGLGLGALSCTVEPAGYAPAMQELAKAEDIHVALGAHPWWVADGRVSGADIDSLVEMLATTRLVGEVGLDFSPKHVRSGSRGAQMEAFSRIVSACVETSDPSHPKVLSIHSVRAATTVLDVLEREGATSACRCVFHWFSGSTDELWRAVRDGCWFSLGERSLATGKGREYAKLVPKDRLLTETDYPPRESAPGSAEEVVESLRRALAGLATARKCEEGEIQELVVENARALLA